jgi:nucleoside-triphosphatase
MERVYLLTGRPGTGKTSLVREVAATLGDRAGGFYTEEIRTGGVREGFRLITLDGQEVILAHTAIKSPYRVSRYGVDIAGLERVGIPAIEEAAQQGKLVVVDEIGKMELFSEHFREAVIKLIDSPAKVLGTIMLTPHPGADEITLRPQVRLLELTRANREEVRKELMRWLASQPLTSQQARL